MVSGRGSRPFLKSKTKRGSPKASRPKRVGATSLRRKNFSTSLSKCTCRSLYSLATRLRIASQANSYLSRHIPITIKGPLMLSDPRLVLERLCAERGEDFAGLSRMLGRNSAYIQQFVRRGVPRRLKEDERRKLARYFAISEALLGGPAEEAIAANGLVSIKRHPVSVSAGPGAIVMEELGKPYFGFDERWLKALTSTPAERLSIVKVEGDSMSPTLNQGDDILVDP